MAFARELQERIGSPLLDEYSGAFLLGSTAPDIRVITGWDRRDTHFFDFDDFEHQDGVAGFFAHHTHLADPGKVSPATAAFVAGYTTHLTLDEHWIVEIYRTHFGERSPLAGALEAQVLDRLLQYELDRRSREDRGLMERIHQSLEGIETMIECGFIERDTLRQWRELAAEQTTYPGDYDRLRHYSGRQLRAWGVNPQVDEEFGAFVERVPGLLDAALERVGREQFDAFVERSYDDAQRVVERYLSCA